MNKFSLLLIFQAFVLQSLQFVSANELIIEIKKNRIQEVMAIAHNHPLAQEVLDITKKIYPFIPNNNKRLTVEINTTKYGPAEYEQNDSVIKILKNPNNGDSWFPMLSCGINSANKALSKLEFLERLEEKETSIDSLTRELINSLSKKNDERSIGLNEHEIEILQRIFAIFNRGISLFMDKLQESFKMKQTKGQLFVDFFEKHILKLEQKNEIINLFCNLNGSSSAGYLPYLALPELIKWYYNKKTAFLLIKRSFYKQSFMIQDWSLWDSEFEYRPFDIKNDDFGVYCLKYLLYEFIVKNKVEYK